MALQLYTYPENSRAFKILVTAKYVGVNVAVAPYTHGETNKTPEFLAKNPLGKVPTLDTPDGPIYESNAIVRYVARLHNPAHGGVAIYGNSVYESGLIDQWIDFTTSEIELPASAWLYPILGYIPNNPTATNKAKNDIKKVLSILDHHLLTRTFLVGNTITIADIVVAASLFNLYKLVLDPGFRKAFLNTNRWFTTIVNQPEFKEVAGEFKLAERMAAAPAPAERERPEREEKPKAEKPKKEEKPKEPKAEKPKKAEAAPEEEEEDYEKEEKKPNPLDNLPKSTFVLDEWKRTYSNNDTRAVALPWFFEHYDPAGYSIFFCEYKYNNELSKVFMTSNLINGFFQRLEKLHKYGFGSMIIFGEEPNLTVSGVWVFRGNEVPAIMIECDDYTNYSWRPMDVANPEDKKTIEDYFAWDGEFAGKHFNAGKAYK